MPIYPCECPRCGRVEILRKSPTGLEEAPCPKCGATAVRLWEPAGLPPFRAYWTEALSIGSRPIEVKSREQEAALCSKLNCARVS